MQAICYSLSLVLEALWQHNVHRNQLQPCNPKAHTGSKLYSTIQGEYFHQFQMGDLGSGLKQLINCETGRHCKDKSFTVEVRRLANCLITVITLFPSVLLFSPAQLLCLQLQDKLQHNENGEKKKTKPKKHFPHLILSCKWQPLGLFCIQNAKCFNKEIANVSHCHCSEIFLMLRQLIKEPKPQNIQALRQQFREQ